MAKTQSPALWCADLLVPVDPLGPIASATPEGPDYPHDNELWSPADQTIRLAGAANEVLAFQLVAEKKAGRVESIRLQLDGGDVTLAVFQNIAAPVGKGGPFADDALVPVGELSVAEISRKAPKLAGRARQTFTLELDIAAAAAAGVRRGELIVATSKGEHRARIELTVYNFALPGEAGCSADINNYGASIAHQFDVDVLSDEYLALERAYFRMAREHRAIFHLLPYGQSGRIEQGFGPTLAGRGATRRIVDWSAFDRHWGSYLDGSAFAGLKDTRPVEFLYTPVNLNWPAHFEKWGTPGYEHEYLTIVTEMARHFAERGWSQTKFEVFFNHKARWKYYPWDMDEERFERDLWPLIYLAKLTHQACRGIDGVRMITRTDSSWRFIEDSQIEMADVYNLWVVNRGSHSEGPDAVERLRAKGQEVWFYGGAGSILGSRVENLRWPWIAWGRATDGFCWWNGMGWGQWDEIGPGGNHCLYPGKRFGLAGPLASIRLKVLRRGMQDHAYLQLLERKSGRAACDAIVGRTIGTDSREGWYQRHEGVEVGGADIMTGSATQKPWNTAPRAAWEAARRELARAIQG